MLFHELASYFQSLEEAPKRLDKFKILAEMFEKLTAEELAEASFLVQGVLAPPFANLEFNISTKLIIKALAETGYKTAGINEEVIGVEKVTDLYNQTGDLGIVAETLISNKEGNLSISQVFNSLTKIAKLEGTGSVEAKINGISDIFKNSASTSAKYITRFILGKLRFGVGMSSILESLALAVGGDKELKNEISTHENKISTLKEDIKDLKSIITDLDKTEVDNIKEIKDKINLHKCEVKDLKENIKKIGSTLKKSKKELESAYNNHPDIGYIATTLYNKKMEGIRQVKPTVGCPVKVALCERLPTPEDIVAKLGRCAVEIKYDGLRLQVHKQGDKVDMFSRNLEVVTDMFPEITRMVKEYIGADDLIIEGEVISYDKKTDKLLPFQMTMQRKRKHNVDEKAKEIPLRFFIFDLIYVDGIDYSPIAYQERRQKLKNLLKPHPDILPSESITTDDPDRVAEYFDTAIAQSYEGIIAKRLDSPYVAGARNFNWIKFKKSYSKKLSDSIDVCIIGYDYGRGARARFGLGAVLAAVYDKDEEQFKTVTKIGTGFTEQNLADLKMELDKIKTDKIPAGCSSQIKPDVWVEPKYIVTVTADEITRSNMHTCGMTEGNQGYALRFPRAEEILRADKSATDATTVNEIIAMFDIQ